MKLIFHYPKLSRFDFFAFRSPGPGLGNLLFPIARALTAARNDGGVFVEPTIPQIKIGTFLRQENDKRTYVGLFKKRSLAENYIWLKSQIIRLFNKKQEVHDIRFISHEGLGNQFYDIQYENTLIVNWLNRRAKIKPDIHDLDLAIHIRQGDFTKSQTISQSTLLPLEWYKKALQEITKKYDAEIHKIILFTDGDQEQIIKYLDDPRIQCEPRVNALYSLLLMSRAKYMIASCSTFSLWANFLGNNFAYWHKDFNLSDYKNISDIIKY